MKSPFKLSLQFFGDPAPEPAPAPEHAPAPAPDPEPAPLTLEEATKQFKAEVDDLKAQIKDRDATIRLLLNGEKPPTGSGAKQTNFEKMLRL